MIFCVRVILSNAKDLAGDSVLFIKSQRGMLPIVSMTLIAEFRFFVFSCFYV